MNGRPPASPPTPIGGRAASSRYRTMKTTAVLLAAVAAFTALTLPSGASASGSWDVTGFIGAEMQGFAERGQFAGQSGEGNISLFVQPEVYWRSDRHRLSLVGYARWDQRDSERSHVDLREAHWGYEANTWDLVVGVSKVFWGVTESRHLVDVINQTDLVEDIDQEDKLGQPMVNLNFQRDFGRFELFLLPWFRERTFPGEDGRFRPSLLVDTDNPLYESRDEQEHVDVAFRYSHYFGDVDVGLHVFDGTSREPSFVLGPDGDRLLPLYEQMTQYGVDLQYTRDAWLWKLEAIARHTRNDDFAAVVGGLEYSFYGVGGSDADLGLLVEYQYDDRNAAAPPVLSDNDWFAGVRLTMNDASDTSVLIGAAIDADSEELFFNLEAERRFGDSLSAELRLRAFRHAEPGGLLQTLEQDDYVQLRLSWYY